MGRGGQVDAFILDFETAFDSSPPPSWLLKRKLSGFGIGWKTLWWIDSFLYYRKQRVNEETSVWAPVLASVLQGTVLCPLLVSLHINDTFADIDSEIRLFADDCLVSWTMRCRGLTETSKELGKLECWTKHYENTLFQIYWEFYHQKRKRIFRKRNLIFFHMSSPNIDCGYSLEPPRWGGSNKYPQSMPFSKIRKTTYIPVNPSFIYKNGIWGGQNYIDVLDEITMIMQYNADN